MSEIKIFSSPAIAGTRQFPRAYLYKMSRIIKSLQYCTDKNCIRIWNENILDQDLIDNILSSDKESIVLDKALTIIETD